MKVKTLCLGLLVTLLLCCLPLCIGAAPLSPAFAVLANDLSMSKCGLVGNEVTFFPQDFDAMTDSETDSITVLTLPAPENGTLYLYDSPVEKFTEISRNEIKSLTFRTSCDKEISCSFTFRQHTENEKYQAVCHLYMLDRLNFAPCMDSTDDFGAAIGCSTYAGTIICGTVSATDPESDPLRYQIVNYPQKGTLSLNGNEYRYFAFENMVGQDSFSVIAIDRYGNRSEPVTVPVTVLARKSSLNYADMENHTAHAAALTLSYCGALSGRVIGAEAVFHPDEEITRAEFVAALATALGLEGNNETPVFSDSDSVPAHLMPAIAGAVERNWIVSGQYLAFRPNDPITRHEAAALLCNVLDLDMNADVTENENLQALITMEKIGILPPTGKELSPNKALTRADAAMTICRVLDRL